MFRLLNTSIDEALDEIQQKLGNVTEEELGRAKLIETYTYEKDDEDYEQKIYRLPDHTIYVETRPMHTTTIESLHYKLKKAIMREDYKAASRLKTKLDLLK